MDFCDSHGRRISLLSEEEYSYSDTPYGNLLPSVVSPAPTQPLSTPELTRSLSFGSQSSPRHPITPLLSDLPFHRRASDGSQHDFPSPGSDVMKRTLNYPPQLYARRPSSEKTPISGRRMHPCRMAKELGCNKTFTTSGHASRHAKIHSPHKPIRCTYAGCSKSFTRTDNMKQHLETHFRREKSSCEKPQRSSYTRQPGGSSRRRSVESTARSHRGGRSRSPASHASPYTAYSEISYTPGQEQRPAYDRRSSGSGMDLLAIAAEQVASTR